MTDKKYIGESDAYRARREALLDAELDLLDQCERVAALRRQLPTNPVPTDYVFREGPVDLEKDEPIREARLSELFASGKDELLVIHFMFDPAWEKGCPMCSMWADGYNAVAPHVAKRANLVVVAKQRIGPLRAWARERGWSNLRLLSAHDTAFIADFGMEGSGGQQPGVSSFRRNADGGIEHLTTVEAMNRGRFRGMDLLTPVWNLFDLLPGGRGDFMPSH